MQNIIFISVCLFGLAPAFAGSNDTGANPELAALYEKSKAADAATKSSAPKSMPSKRERTKLGVLLLGVSRICEIFLRS